MLIECPECKRQISDAAPSCPGCGYVLSKPQGATELSPAPPAQSGSMGSAPVFLAIATVSLVLSPFTPRILLFFPVMVAVGCSVVSFFRRERLRFGAVIVAVLAIVLFSMSEADMAAPSGANLAAAQIADWNWSKDPTYGGRGTIKWNVEVKNVSDKPLSSVKVDFTSYDASGKLLGSTFTYVEAIPPGETRSDDSFADLYGGEANATVKIAEVRFAQ
jgi:hypothetical protein